MYTTKSWTTDYDLSHRNASRIDDFRQRFALRTINLCRIIARFSSNHRTVRYLVHTLLVPLISNLPKDFAPSIIHIYDVQDNGQISSTQSIMKLLFARWLHHRQWLNEIEIKPTVGNSGRRLLDRSKCYELSMNVHNTGNRIIDFGAEWKTTFYVLIPTLKINTINSKSTRHSHVFSLRS